MSLYNNNTRGGNFFGEAEQDPSNLLPRGVIVVTFNYRLGVLGWLGHRTLTAEAEATLGSLRACGAAVIVVSADVATRAGVRSALAAV